MDVLLLARALLDAKFPLPDARRAVLTLGAALAVVLGGAIGLDMMASNGSPAKTDRIMASEYEFR